MKNVNIHPKDALAMLQHFFCCRENLQSPQLDTNKYFSKGAIFANIPPFHDL